MVKVYHLKKLIPDSKMRTLGNTYVDRKQIKLFIDHDADVYNEDNKLLMKFRKTHLPSKKMNTFYDNVIRFANLKTNNRGSASGSTRKNVRDNPKIATNIIGYFDKLSPMQKMLMRRKYTQKKLSSLRETRFLYEHPEKYKKLIPFITEIDRAYKQLVPDHYKKQKKKADETHFRIGKTAFTTITTNVNYQTTIHTDKGDDSDGFGNLIVIDKGEYTGGEICFPQYGVGVDIRAQDVLFMDVHQWHGNLPIKKKSPDATRLSVVCYLRRRVWEQSRGKSKDFFKRQTRKIRRLKY